MRRQVLDSRSGARVRDSLRPWIRVHAGFTTSSRNLEIDEAERINPADWVAAGICVRVDSARKPDGIALRVAPSNRVVPVPEVVVMWSR